MNNNNQGKPPKQELPSYNVQDLFKGKNLEFIAAALLVTGKLRVTSVELFRSSPAVSVSLLGKYVTTENNHTNALADFLEENGDMTIDDVFAAFEKRMQNGRGNSN